jgi:uncharacterized protein (AIM24 family)
MRSSEKITAESGAMVYMKGDMEIKTRTHEGGFLKKIKVAALGGESFFVNDYIAHYCSWRLFHRSYRPARW